MKTILVISILICNLSFGYGQTKIDTLDVGEITHFESNNLGMNIPVLLLDGEYLSEINLDLRKKLLEHENFINEKDLETKVLLDSFSNAGVGLDYELFCDNNLLSLEFHGQNDWGIYECYNYSLTTNKQILIYDLVGCEGMLKIYEQIDELRTTEREKVYAHFDSLLKGRESIEISSYLSIRNEVLESIGFSKVDDFFVTDSALVIYLNTWHDNFDPVEKFPLFFDKKMIRID